MLMAISFSLVIKASLLESESSYVVLGPNKKGTAKATAVVLVNVQRRSCPAVARDEH